MNRNRKLTSGTALAAVAVLWCFVAAPAMAQTTFTFDASQGHWDVAANWLPDNGRVPESGDTAIILAGQQCAIPTGYAAVTKIIELEKDSDGSDYGEVLICEGGSLKLEADCPDIEGIIWFWKSDTSTAPGQLIIDGDITLTGHLSTTGGVPAYVDSEPVQGVSGIIKGVDANSKLTLAGASAHSDFRIIGEVEIEIELVNEAMVGNAEGTLGAGFNRTLTLSTNPKSGDGTWFASRGKLLVDDGCAVSGGGRWEINQVEAPGQPGVIQFDEQALGLTGPFQILAGTLDVNDNIKTEGRLDFHRALSEDTEIRVAAGKTAEFGFNTTCP